MPALRDSTSIVDHILAGRSGRTRLVAGVGTDIMNSPREAWDELNYAPAREAAMPARSTWLRCGKVCRAIPPNLRVAEFTGGQHRGVHRILLHAPDPITPDARNAH